MQQFLRTYGKTLAALLAEIGLVAQAAISDDVITQDEWVKLGIGLAAVVSVFFAPARTNQPPLGSTYNRGGPATPAG